MVDATFKRETFHATPLELSVFDNWLGAFLLKYWDLPYVAYSKGKLMSINAWVACLVVSKSIHDLNLIINGNPKCKI